jgi:hypothetical protein
MDIVGRCKINNQIVNTTYIYKANIKELEHQHSFFQELFYKNTQMEYFYCFLSIFEILMENVPFVDQFTFK